MPTTGFDKSSSERVKGVKRRLRKMESSVRIPSVSEVFGVHKITQGNASGYDFLPTEELIKTPVALDTSKMARDWARGKIKIKYSYE